VEDEFVSREKKILSILEQEISDGEEMTAAVRHIAERMLYGEKGYTQADVRKDVRFPVTIGPETVESFVDFLVTVDNRNAMVIKCAPGSLSSRERHVVAAARVLDSMPVPVAVVMDPLSAVVLDTMLGKVTGEGFDAIPTKKQLISILSRKELLPIAPEKLEREKRVLLAFDALRCCIPQGANGGVLLDKNGDM
jgi:Type I restriction enzyme R protein N terminus (HSDR_N)